MTPKIRNHRKLLIVDDIIGYCGGMNIANEYCGSDVGGTGTCEHRGACIDQLINEYHSAGFFRDTMMRLQGPIVGSLKQIFDETEAAAKVLLTLIEISTITLPYQTK